ncbi:MAG: GNAT family N-acetyltransferase [Flavipsychrobacter sp.]|nr:GNAT family N-acetyltransferase [Flavipsychrobacter sp.]
MYEVVIRRAEPADVFVVYNMLCSLSQKEHDKLRFEKCYERNVSDERIIYMIAEVNGEPSGFISCHSQQLLHHSGTAYEIQEMYIDEAYRGNGVGKKMVAAVHSQIEPTEYDVFEVTSSNWREEAHAFYMNNGFVQTHMKFTRKGNR